MKLIKTIEAEGQVLCHDLTQIIKGEYKDARFRKGHIVTKEDIPVLLSMGKEHLYVWEMQEGILHENDAAERLAALCRNGNMSQTSAKEGKIELKADIDGYFTVDTERLNDINMLEDIMIATRHGNTAVHKGDKLCGTRIIPLVIEEERLNKAEDICGKEPLLTLHPYKIKTAGVITTGSEVFKGLIKDTFTPVIKEKLSAYGVEAKEHIITDDGIENIKNAIKDMRSRGVGMICVTGGMSVDPDDNTPGAIKQSGARIVSYGAPVLPGAMFLMGYFDDGTPVMGLPGCVMYAGATIFDLILPRVCAGIEVDKKHIASFGNGGLCLGCSKCHYPICPFGK